LAGLKYLRALLQFVRHAVIMQEVSISAYVVCRYGLNEPAVAERLQSAVSKALDDGYRTVDIMGEGCKEVTCSQMGEVLAESVAQ
jgi:3-isopropylmalate dehydrogenase